MNISSPWKKKDNRKETAAIAKYQDNWLKTYKDKYNFLLFSTSSQTLTQIHLKGHILFKFTIYVNKNVRVKSYLFSYKIKLAVIKNVIKFYS